jgi:hypothetical protein
LPDYNIIIEVYGVYWHSRPGQWEYDAVKQFVYAASGFKVYILTDVQILNNVTEALNDIPELAAATIHGTNWISSRRPYNPVAALAARLRKWPKVNAIRYARPRGQQRAQPAAKWNVNVPPTKAKPPVGGLVTGLTPEIEAEAAKIVDLYHKKTKKHKK